VELAVAAGIEVSTVPGPSALVGALVVSGLPTDRFCFEGFLPRKGSDRRARLGVLGHERRTCVIYESPLRLMRTLEDLSSACGGTRQVAVVRELTKLHEEVWRGSLEEAVGEFSNRQLRGEIVLVLGGAPAEEAPGDDRVEEAVRMRLEAGDSAREAATEVASRLGVPRRRAYELALKLRNGLRADGVGESEGGS
jgi:16S rRNA (cytidine1402-2'-O)-methyltransferase